MNAKQRRALKRAPLLDLEETPSSLTRITRSFSIKLNLARFGDEYKYESADFFCSQSVEHRREDEQPASDAVFAFCKAQVLNDRKAFIQEIKTKLAQQQEKKGRAA